VIDLASLGQLRLMQLTTGKDLSQAGAAFKFGPPGGVNSLTPRGWEPKDVQGMLKRRLSSTACLLNCSRFCPNPREPGGRATRA